MLARLSLLPVVESVDFQMSFEPEMVSSFLLDDDSLCCDWSRGRSDLAGESDPSPVTEDASAEPGRQFNRFEKTAKKSPQKTAKKKFLKSTSRACA